MLKVLRKNIADINIGNAEEITGLCRNMQTLRAGTGRAIADLENITLEDLKHQQRAHYRLGFARGYLTALVKQHIRLKHIQRHYGHDSGKYTLKVERRAKLARV